jgi:hypothetical protein
LKSQRGTNKNGIEKTKAEKKINFDSNLPDPSP